MLMWKNEGRLKVWGIGGIDREVGREVDGRGKGVGNIEKGRMGEERGVEWGKEIMRIGE